MTAVVSSWAVHKFGGTSVADAERYRNVGKLVSARAGAGRRLAVVVSAMSKVTDALFALCAQAARHEDVEPGLVALARRHHDAARALVDDARAAALVAAIDDDVQKVRELLRALFVLGGRHEQIEEVIAGHGEVWSAQLLAAHLGAPFLDARKVLVVRPHDLGPQVDWPESRARTQAFVARHPAPIVVVTGYIASTPDGVPTTLKRNGSDFSASIFGALLDAQDITIWTDVDGVLSADPRRVPEAVLLEEMSYQEAMELAYFGAKVVHPRTMQPAVDKGIPIWIKNTFRPEVRGTVIHAPSRSASSSSTSAAARGPAVKGFTTIDDIAVLNLEGTGMVGVPGVAERLFGALRQVGVSVVVISQASSEHSICFAVPEAQADLARTTVERAFSAELAAGLVSRVDVERGQSILAAVGDAMAERPGVAARFFSALGDVGVNVRAVAQGSSERNITAVIGRADSTRALRAVHARFLLSDLVLSLGVVGRGLIGKALLSQIEQQRGALHEHARVDLRVRALCDSKQMWLADERLDLGNLPAPQPLDLEAFAAHVRADHLPHAAIVDCTASDAVADRYAGWLARRIHVVTPNKRAASGDLGRWQKIDDATNSGARYLGEATVGAGLPILTTLRDLLLTGDKVRAVEGVLSGTLSFIFNALGEAPSTSLSAMVRRAQQLGYTEPDPREDLSGLDFARKLVVLARTMGRPVALDDVDIEDLAPGLPFGAPLESLLAGLAPVDARIAERQREASARGEVLRFVGTIPEVGAPSVALRALPRTHPFAGLSGTDNVVAFTTARYDQQPLVVRGPGAGPDVTAGGVFGDLLRLAAHLGARVL